MPKLTKKKLPVPDRWMDGLTLIIEKHCFQKINYLDLFIEMKRIIALLYQKNSVAS